MKRLTKIARFCKFAWDDKFTNKLILEYWCSTIQVNLISVNNAKENIKRIASNIFCKHHNKTYVWIFVIYGKMIHVKYSVSNN